MEGINKYVITKEKLEPLKNRKNTIKNNTETNVEKSAFMSSTIRSLDAKISENFFTKRFEEQLKNTLGDSESFKRKTLSQRKIIENNVSALGFIENE